jgi:hypothetical protein
MRIWVMILNKKKKKINKKKKTIINNNIIIKIKIIEITIVIIENI